MLFQFLCYDIDLDISSQQLDDLVEKSSDIVMCYK